ncbi:ABC transporter substrate-binding protein [Rhodocyclus purpureus]|uniref:ABC transporter substrate-binding protein n=1 Tax=Rhodocyclus purpureus TaxID=1067 RepID=UPI0019147336|nr:ABC transporter substrate-binding protein [Rhodocyclus purpureus]MBK5913599.1 peptide ABC transporter substrate-binding protein [Rhodocyclus purpureus]
MFSSRRSLRFSSFLALPALALLLAACGSEWNDPYPAEQRGQNILYSAFTERPKHLDPAQSYTEDEITFTAQIYEPPLQYHYLKRPYTLIPATATAVPVARLYDAEGRELPADAPADRVDHSVYEIRIKPGIRYQPHPAFAVDAGGAPRYADLDRARLAGIDTLSDFAETGSRELSADDYIYQIKRLAHPRLHSPIFGMMAERIVGLKELGATLAAAAKDLPQDGWLDLDRYPLAGVERVDAHTWRVTVRGKYPQFLYWLAMPFFAPIPREADRFYSQPGMAEKNLTLDWYPVGTGPYLLAENNPNSRMVLARNPNFHGETYPCEGEPGDAAAGLLADCGKPLPFIERAIFTREKESVPYWNKFLQGYYDASGISSDSFDQAVRLATGGDVQLTDEMLDKGIKLLTSVRASIFYMGFNMVDPVVGGLSEPARKLRQAISIAIDQEEFISIFMNGRGVPAMGPLPPGIFGYEDGEAGINPVVYRWRDGKERRRPLAEAQQLLAEAGWPNGRNARTGEPLVLYLDTTGGGMGDKSRLDWLTRQFAGLGIQLVVRSTDFNRFQEKLRKSSAQLYYIGWNADYPDPENFLFLLHGAEAKVKSGGENYANYQNAEYDRLFREVKDMDSGPERLVLIRRMLDIVRNDAPWVFGFHPKTYTLGHAWLANRKPTDVGNNILKYQRIDVPRRERLREEWNRPLLWPLAAGGAALLALLVPAVVGYRRRERSAALEKS